MLKVRVIVSLMLNDGVLFRTKRFVPDYRYTLNFVSLQSVDEVVILDITRPGEGDRANFEKTVREFTDKIMVPLAIGGGIKCLDDVKRLIGEFPCDKVIINTASHLQPWFIEEITQKYGRQICVAGIDVRSKSVYTEQGHCLGRRSDPVDWASVMTRRGAGEIFLQSIDRDGSLEGYDLDLLDSVAGAISVPVIIGGGCGRWEHMREAYEHGACGAVTNNIYHFTEPSLRAAKEYLNDAGVPVRMDA